MAADVQLILDAGKDGVHNIDVPLDMRVIDFVADIRESLDITDDRDTLHSKELGRPLEANKTLGDNGVQNGYHLFLTPPVVVAVENDPLPVGSEDQPGRRWILPLIAGIVLVLVAFGSYTLGATNRTTKTVDTSEYKRLTEQQARELSQVKEQLAAAEAKLSDREATIAALQKGPDEVKAELAETRRKLQDSEQREGSVQKSLSQAQAEIASLKNRVQQASTSSSAERSQLRTLRNDLDNVQTENARLRAEIQSLKSTSGSGSPGSGPRKVGDPGNVEYFRRPAVAAAGGTIWWTGQVESGQTILIDGGKASSGSIRGDMLPGVPVKIVSVVPGDIGVSEFPQASNGWKRLALRSRVNNKVVVVVQWATVTGAEKVH